MVQQQRCCLSKADVIPRQVLGTSFQQEADQRYVESRVQRKVTHGGFFTEAASLHYFRVLATKPAAL